MPHHILFTVCTLLLTFLTCVACLAVSLPPSAIAGAPISAQWTRNSRSDPVRFILKPRNVDSTKSIPPQQVPVDSQNKSEGQVQFTFPGAGTFIVESFHIDDPKTPSLGSSSNIEIAQSNDVARTSTTSSSPSQTSSSFVSKSSKSASSSYAPSFSSPPSNAPQSSLFPSAPSDSSKFETSTQSVFSDTSSEIVTSLPSPSILSQTSPSEKAIPASITDIPTNHPSKNKHVGVIVGSVIGAIVLLSIIGVVLFIIRRRARRKHNRAVFFRDMMVRHAIANAQLDLATKPSGAVATNGYPFPSYSSSQPGATVKETAPTSTSTRSMKSYRKPPQVESISDLDSLPLSPRSVYASPSPTSPSSTMRRESSLYSGLRESSRYSQDADNARGVPSWMQLNGPTVEELLKERAKATQDLYTSKEQA